MVSGDLYFWTNLVFAFSKLLIFINSLKAQAELDASFPESVALAQRCCQNPVWTVLQPEAMYV